MIKKKKKECRGHGPKEWEVRSQVEEKVWGVRRKEREKKKSKIDEKGWGGGTRFEEKKEEEKWEKGKEENEEEKIFSHTMWCFQNRGGKVGEKNLWVMKKNKDRTKRKKVEIGEIWGRWGARCEMNYEEEEEVLY